MMTAAPSPLDAAALPPVPARLHFIGIGGIGMSGLARILAAEGYRISGSDVAGSELTEQLAAEGIAVTIGHDRTDAVGAADLIVVTAAMRPDNPEMTVALAGQTPVIKRAALLGFLANARHQLAVAGSHGKSTTAGMLVAALRSLGADPTYAIGAVLAATGTNAAPGAGDLMVVEADEYDYSFLHLTPDIAIITNIDYDHPDLFPDQAAYDRAFARFTTNVRADGVIVAAIDDSGCARLLSSGAIPSSVTIVTVGETDDAEWCLTGREGDWRVRLPGGEERAMPLGVPGRHNARNATAALAALAALGYDAAAALAAVGAFTGVGRRFELKGEVAGVMVIDDYAHHPRELRAALLAARERFPDRRRWAVFQPHTFSRTKALLDDFAGSFSDADRVMILDVYAARETDALGISARDLIAKLPAPGVLARGPGDAATRLATLVEPGDVVLTLGAGDVTTVGPKLLNLLRRDREGAPNRPESSR